MYGCGEARHVHRDVCRAPRRTEPGSNVQNGYRRFRRDPRDRSDNVFIQHDVANNYHLGGAETVSKRVHTVICSMCRGHLGCASSDMNGHDLHRKYGALYECADRVRSRDVNLLYDRGVRGRSCQEHVALFQHGTALRASKAYGDNSSGTRRYQSTKHVWRFARGGDPQKNVSRMTQSLQLSLKDVVVAVVIGNGRQDRGVRFKF